MRDFSIITPTYNRRDVLGDSIHSSLALIRETGEVGELIVVDDASDDATEAHLRHRFAAPLDDGTIKFIRMPFNVGVIAAREVGIRAARGTWLIFLDSDDQFVPGVGPKLLAELKSSADSPIVFFRCIDMKSGQLVGPVAGERQLTLQELLAEGTPGECLPVVQRKAITAVKHDTDLRGFESLIHARVLRQFGPARLSSLVARRYCTEKTLARLSTRRGRAARACQMVEGYRRVWREFGSEEGVRKGRLLTRILYYSALCIGRRLAAGLRVSPPDAPRAVHK